MRWTKEEKLKMVLEYKNNGYMPIVEGCSRRTMYEHIRRWAKAYDLYGESGYILIAFCLIIKDYFLRDLLISIFILASMKY